MLRVISLFGIFSVPFFSQSALPQETDALANPDYVVYSVYRALDLGAKPRESAPKDYYVNMGSQQGLQKGALLEIRRKVPTYDILSSQLYRDLTLPVALVKVIHVEPEAAITRLEKFYPLDQAPVVSPRAIMVGDYVRYPEKN